MTRHELYLLAKSIKHAAKRLGLLYDRTEDLRRDDLLDCLPEDAVQEMRQIVNAESWLVNPEPLYTQKDTES